MRCFFSVSRCVLIFSIPLVVSVFAFARDASSAPRISKQTREEIIHAFNQDLIYIHTNFPMGRSGLRLKDGTVTPSGEELKHMMALWGPAAKPGDLARISDVVIKDNYIHFEINGGPVKRQKWYQHITIQGAGSATPIAPSDPSANARGSYVDLYFDKYVPELTGPELKELLRPVFDFDSKSAVDAYLETVSPQVKDAIKNHRVLVGMNREMVIYSKGRPPKKDREVTGEMEYEEWIYGTPPEDVDFVRFVGDEVVRLETMKVSGEKIVKVEKEVDLGAPTVAKKQDEPRPKNAPTLRRPGEQVPERDPEAPSNTAPIPPVDAPSPPSGSPDPNWDATPAPVTK